MTRIDPAQPADSPRPTVIVTGSSGLIGTRVIAALQERYTVVGMDARQDPPGHEWIKCDLSDDASVIEALQQVRDGHGDRIASVIHLAAYYDFSGADSDLYEKLTVQGTRRLLRGLRQMATEQFVFSSSLLVMKPVQPGQLITETSEVQAEWAYPQSKLDAEEVIRGEHGSISAVSLRIAGVYDEDCSSIPIAQQIARIHQKQLESYLFPGHKDHGQAFVHVDDVVDCIVRTVERRQQLGPFEVLLVAEPDVMTYEELQDAIGEQLHGKEWPTIRIPKLVAKAGAWFKDKLAGDEGAFIKPWMIDLADAHYAVDASRAHQRLGWVAQRRLRHTLPEMLRRLQADPQAWYRHNKLPPPDGDDGGDDGGSATGDAAPMRPGAGPLPDMHAHPPPFHRNPSSWAQRVPISVLAAIAFVLASYLALYQWGLIDSVWDPVFGEQTAKVLSSPASQTMHSWLRMPDAALGAFGYLGDAVLGLAGSTRRWQYRPWMVLLFGIDVIPLGGVSAILVVMQGTVVGSWCFLCLVTAAISLVLVVMAYDEVWATLQYLRRVWQRTHSWRVLWRTFCGIPSADAEAAALPQAARP